MADLRTQIGVYMNPRDLQRYLQALSRLETQAQRSKDDLPRLQATDYVHLLHRNIMAQKYLPQWPRYSKRYAEWKAKVGAINKGYWRLFDSLLNNLTVWRVLSGRAGERAWKGGIPAHVLDKGGTSWYGTGEMGPPKPIAMYARVNEFGDDRHPARPLFVPTKEEYEGKGFPERGERELRRLANEWK